MEARGSDREAEKVDLRVRAKDPYLEGRRGAVEARADRILRKDPSVTGFNIGMNCCDSAGQTVVHAHIHLIPRRAGDTPNPRGGVRGVIPGKMSYGEGEEALPGTSH